jgi:hypothetical protein
MNINHFDNPINPHSPAKYKNRGAKLTEIPVNACTIVQRGEFILFTHFELITTLTLSILIYPSDRRAS